MKNGPQGPFFICCADRDRDQAGASLGSVNNLFGGSLGQSVVAAFGQ